MSLRTNLGVYKDMALGLWRLAYPRSGAEPWIPAFAGMTTRKRMGRSDGPPHRVQT